MFAFVKLDTKEDNLVLHLVIDNCNQSSEFLIFSCILYYMYAINNFRVCILDYLVTLNFSCIYRVF